MRSLVLILTFIVLAHAQARVWEEERQWNPEWELEYSNWVKNELKEDLFSDQNSPFYGVQTDCADFIFAQRVIFSYINKLPFFLTKKLSNHSLSYDHLETGNERVKALISDIADTFGSDALAREFSYPIALDQIRSGDIFIYREDDGNFHSYLIKNLQENGNLELWYSTVPKAVRQIIKRVGMPARPITNAPYGFLRLKTAEQIQKKITPPLKDNEQYQLVREYGKKQAMVEIKRRLRLRPETIREAIDRRIDNSCALIEARVAAINMNRELFQKIGYRCLSSKEIYNYSTPSRDRVLFESIMGLAELWLKVKKHDAEEELGDEQIERALDYLVKSDISREGKRLLKNLCSQDAPIDLRTYIIKYKKGLISPNPHHPPATRWGPPKKSPPMTGIR